MRYDKLFFTHLEILSDDSIDKLIQCAEKFQHFYVLTYNSDLYQTLSEILIGHQIIFVKIERDVWPGCINNIVSYYLLSEEYYYVDIFDSDLLVYQKTQISTSLIEEIINNNLTKTFFYENYSDIPMEISRCIFDTKNESLNFVQMCDQLIYGATFEEKFNIESIINVTDFDMLNLKELQLFFDKIENEKVFYKNISKEIENVVANLKQLLIFIPRDPVQLCQENQNNEFIKNGFPVIYKIYSALNYAAYKRTNELNLNNKSFMHLFRTLEYYYSGLTILSGRATFSNGFFVADITNRKGFQKISGFGSIFSFIKNTYGNINNETISKFLKLRNKFHYTHGDVRISNNVIFDFEKIVLNVIHDYEIEQNQYQIEFDYLVELILTSLKKSPSYFIIKRLGDFYLGNKFQNSIN